jgi:hypothetical protein
MAMEVVVSRFGEDQLRDKLTGNLCVKGSKACDCNSMRDRDMSGCG